MGVQPALLRLLCTLYQSLRGEVISSVRGYKASQLLFSWLLQMISLQFSCNSRLVWEEVSDHVYYCLLFYLYFWHSVWHMINTQIFVYKPIEWTNKSKVYREEMGKIAL